MRRTVLLLCAVTTAVPVAIRHEALAQQPTPLTGAAAPAKAKANEPTASAPSTKSRKKAPAKATKPSATPAPSPAPPVMPPMPPPVVEILPMDLPPPASNTPPAPASPGAGSVASGITPVRYAAPTPGSTRLTSSVPVLPPKAMPRVESSAGAPASMAPAIVPAMPRVTPYSPPIFWPPVPGRKPAQSQTQTVGNGMAVNSPMASAEAKPGYTAVVPITPFGTAPPAEPAAPAPPQARDPITFTVRLPTIIMLESKP